MKDSDPSGYPSWDHAPMKKSNIYGIEVNQRTYKLIHKDAGLPNTYTLDPIDLNGNANLIAFIAVFMVIMVLIGILCFLLGSGIGGRIGYNRGSKSNITSESAEKSRYKLVEVKESI